MIVKTNTVVELTPGEVLITAEDAAWRGRVVSVDGVVRKDVVAMVLKVRP